MKKFAMALIAGTMLLSNVAFAATNGTEVNNTGNGSISSVSTGNVYYPQSQDPKV